MLQSIKNSENKPWDFSGTNYEELIYDSSVNEVKKTEIQTVIKLMELNYSAGNFLVICFSVDKKQTKVVRYSDTENIQSIPVDGKMSTSLFLQRSP